VPRSTQGLLFQLNNSSVYERGAFLKHVFSAFPLIRRRCYSPAYLHALMASEEWEAGEEKRDRVSGLVFVSLTAGKKQHGERKDEGEREREATNTIFNYNQI